LSLPPVNPLWRASLEERREPLRRPTGSQPPPPPPDALEEAADAGGSPPPFTDPADQDDIDIDIHVDESVGSSAEESSVAEASAAKSSAPQSRPPIEIDFEALGEEAALVAAKLKEAKAAEGSTPSEGAPEGAPETEAADETPKKKRRRWPWVVLGLLLALVVGGGVAARLGYLNPLIEKLPPQVIEKLPIDLPARAPKKAPSKPK
jgi:hypothetical protein